MTFAPGVHALKFDTNRFDFRSLLLDHFRDAAAARGFPRLERLEDMHLLPGIADDVEDYRQQAFAFFRTEAFQTLFKGFGAWLIDEHFGGEGLFQKTPTVRIQIPGAMTTSFHTDGWYGHGQGVCSFWLPLTEVRNGNTLYMAPDAATARACEDRIFASRATLPEINRLAREVCQPLEGGFGDFWTFSSDMIHGAADNTLGWSRFSFDFRIVPAGASLGSKPRSNYFSRAELDGEQAVSVHDAAPQVKLAHGITYSNACGGRSAKAQLMLASAHAQANGIGIVGSESEILKFDYLPVLRSYLGGADVRADCVVTFGLDIFEGDAQLMEDILDCADKGGRSIVFAAEGLTFSPGAEREPCRVLLRQRSQRHSESVA